ncbi:MAG: hypothetical protein ACREBD_25770 [Blastocatellia bacterium]
MRMPRCKFVEIPGFNSSKQRVWRQASLVLVLMLAITNCSPNTGKMQPLLPNGVANLVIVYKKGVTDEQIEYFLNNALAQPRADGRGYELLPAIGLQARLKSIQGYDATAIAYHSYATPEQREDVKRAALSSSIVYKVLEDIVPSQIKRIE